MVQNVSILSWQSNKDMNKIFKNRIFNNCHLHKWVKVGTIMKNYLHLACMG